MQRYIPPVNIHGVDYRYIHLQSFDRKAANEMFSGETSGIRKPFLSIKAHPPTWLISREIIISEEA